MNDYVKYDVSKRNDEKIVAFCKKHGRKAVAYPDRSKEDMVGKIDMSLEFKDGKTYNIDSKYTDKNCNGWMWFECEKHAKDSSSKADYILYCFRSTHYKTCWLVSRDALCKLALDGRKTRKPNKDLLVDFSLSELHPDDYKVIDFSKLGLD